VASVFRDRAIAAQSSNDALDLRVRVVSLRAWLALGLAALVMLIGALWMTAGTVGVTVAGFPNLFLLYGPNTNLGHNSIIVMIEAQVGYMVEALKALKARGAKALTVRPQAHARFNAQLQQDLAGTAWAGSCSSWYKTDSGKITNNWSGDTATYVKLMKQPALEDYEVA
jgi:cation diffusion facilitator CzcD-associated flavoprotein CzcO